VSSPAGASTTTTATDRGQLDRPQEGAYQQLVDDYRDDPSPALREHVARALNNRGVALGQLDRPQEALGAYRQLIDDYRDDPSPALGELVAKALDELRGTGGPH
jgi:tetratricopeptide (TPR) repeat protein